MISICLFGLTACGQIGKDPTHQNTHAHDLENISAKASTCVEGGNIEYWYCKDCDKFFADAEAETEITEAETLLEVDGTAHTYGEWETVTEATCELEGKKERVCSACGGKETQTLAKVAHTYGEWTTVTTATCAVEGKQEKTCSVCGDKQTQTLPKVAHTYGEWTTVTPATCTTDGTQEKTCSVCNDKVTETLPKLGHKYGEWTTVTAATCAVEGKQEKTCSVCGDKQTQTLAKVAHTYGEWTTVTAATCAVEGKQEKTCLVCGDKQTQTIAKVAHTYGEWTTVTAATCTTDGTQEKTCSVCNDKQTQILPKLGHTYGEWITVKEATCGAEGQKKRTCSVCNEAETEVIPMLTEHTYGEWTIVTAATCAVEGKQEKTCSVCGDKQTQTISKVAHTYGEWTITTEPTCQVEGAQEKVCTVCGDKLTQTLPTVEHKYGEWLPSEYPTCQKEGIEKRYCEYCKDMQTRPVSKVDHKYGEWTTVTPSTCFEQGVQHSVCEYCGDTKTQYLPIVNHEYDETGHCIYCQEALPPTECKHENVHPVEVEGGHRTICDICKEYLTEVMEHTFSDNEYSWEEIDGEQAHGRKCIECGANVIEKCTIIGPAYMEYYDGQEFANGKIHFWNCSVCRHQTKYEEHSFWRSEEQAGVPTKICDECGYQYVCETHSYDESGFCGMCGHQCPHENKTLQESTHISFTDLENGKLVHSYYCQDCNCTIEEDCNFNNGVCTVCQGKCEHSDVWAGNGYVDQGSKHSCVYCGLLSDHEYSYVDRGKYCLGCGHECTHENVVDCRCTICKSSLHNLGELLSDDSGHYRICSVCNKRFHESDHVFDEFGKCSKCGYVDQSIATCVHEPSDRYVAREGGHRAICKKCEMEYGEVIPHVEGENYVSSSNGEGHQNGCTYCYEGFGEVFPHAYDQNVNDRESSCSVCYAPHTHTYDSETGVCSTCNHTCKHSGTFYNSEMEGHRCEFCYKAFEHNFNSNGECAVCGYSCQHQSGFTDGACVICGFTCPHLASFNPMNEKEHECAFCHSVFPHNYDSNGNCMQCSAPCPHRYVSVNESMHRCEICNREEMHVCDAGMPCYYCGYQCVHKNYMEFEDHCECSDCHVVMMHGEEPCIMCGKVQSTACDHSFGFGEGTEQGHPCNRCAEILPHNCDELGNCMDCGYKMPCEHDFSGNAFAPTEEGHIPMCVKCGASGEIIPHSQGGYHAEPGNDGHKTYCAVCGYPYGELLPHVVESDGSGLCSLCGEHHEHSYSGEICTTCNHTCSHTAAGGRDCGNESYHLCGYCNAEMLHDFSGDMNMCMQCGYQKSTQA